MKPKRKPGLKRMKLLHKNLSWNFWMDDEASGGIWCNEGGTEYCSSTGVFQFLQGMYTKDRCLFKWLGAVLSEQAKDGKINVMLCKVVGYIMYIMLMRMFYLIFYQIFLGLFIIKIFFLCSMLVSIPPYTTITHLQIPLLSKCTLIYYSWNKD